MRKCLQCDKEIIKKDKKQRFCNRHCSVTFNNKIRKPYSEATKNKLRAAALGNTNSVKIPKLLNCNYCKKEFIGVSAKYCSRKCQRHFKTNGRPPGGFQERSGRGKYGYYEGIWCQSTYEMAYVWYCKMQNKDIKRNSVGFPYLDEFGMERLYIPDFIVNDTYIEVKGWMNDRVDLKIKMFPHKIELLVGEGITGIVKQAQQYFKTKNLAEIYAENKRPSLGFKTCLVCNTKFEQKHKQKGICCSRSCAGKLVKRKAWK